MSNDDHESDDDSDSEWNDELINAVRRKQSKTKPIAEKERIERIQECLNEGAVVDAVDKDKNTALHIAVKKGYIKVVQFLVEQKAKTDIPNRNKQTALTLAEAPGKTEILSVLKGLVNHERQSPPRRTPTPMEIDAASSDPIASTSRAHVPPAQIFSFKNNAQNLKRKNATDIEYNNDGKQRRFESNGSPLREAQLCSFFDTADEEQNSFGEDCQSEDENDVDGMVHQQATQFDGEDRYAASGLKQTLHGNIYQLKLLMLFLKRGLRQGYAFRLATEMDAAEKFDDLGFQCHNYANRGPVYRFLQAKHKLDEYKKISVRDVLTEKDDEFSLQKYFISYCKMKKHPELSKLPFEDFIICTNIDFDIEGLKSVGINLVADSKTDALLDIKSSRKKAARYKLLVTNQSELYKILRRTSESYRLARILVQYIYDSKDISLRNEIFKLYHTALAKEVINVETLTFHKNFVDGQNLSASGNRFRKIFCEEVVNQSKSLTRNSLEKDVWQEITKNPLKLPSTFGQQPKLIPNPKLTSLNQFSAELVNLINNADTHKMVQIDRKIYSKGAKKGSNEKVIADNLEQLAGHVLIMENKKIKFRSQFLDGGKLTGDIAALNDLLKTKLQLKYDDLDQYHFQISRFKTWEEEQLYWKTELPDDVVDDNDIAQFFDKLIFAVNQPNEDDLGDIITKEIAEDSQFNLLNADLVGAAFQKEMLDWFKKKGREKGKEGTFFSNEDGRAFFDSVERKVNTLVSSGLGFAYLQELKQYSVELEDENENLKDFLTSDPGDRAKPPLNLIASGETLLSAIRIYQTLRQTGRYEKNDSLIFLRLRTLLLPGIKDRVIRAFESPDSHHLLIIECESATTQGLERLYHRLCETMKNNIAKKLILITQGSQSSRSNVRFKNCYKIHDDITFDDLTANSQYKLLGKPIINFQERKRSMSFRRLLGIRSCDDISSERLTNFIRLIDPSTLVKLICGEEIELGEGVRGWDKIESYYINRRFNRKTVNHKIPGRRVTDREEPRSVDESTASYLTEAQLVDCNEDQKIVIISETSGMGKTTVLTYIEKEMKDTYPGLWVIRIDLNNFTAELQMELKSRSFDVGDTNGAVDYFVEKLANLKTDWEKAVLKILLKSQGGIALLFDGFDEISPQYESIVIELLQAFHKLGVGKLFVTTRPHMRIALENELGPFSYTIEPFSDEDRIEFLVRFWKKSLDLNDVRQRIEERLRTFTDENQIDLLVRLWKKSLDLNDVKQRIKERLRTYAKALIEKVCNTINDRMNVFAGIPLHTRMIAEVFQDNRDRKLGARDFEGCEEFLCSENDEPKLPEKMNIFDLYRRFIDKKYYIYRTEKKKEDPSNLAAEEDSKELRKIFLQWHQKLALYTLFESHDETILELLQHGMEGINAYLTKIKEGKERTGIIIRVINGKPQFIHRTFAEYFVADFLLDTLKCNHHNPQVRIFIVEQVLLHPNHRIIRAFLNGLLTEQLLPSNSQYGSNISTDGSWKLDLAERRGSCGGTIFHIAAKEGNYTIIKYFLMQFCKDSDSRMELMNAKDCLGRTILFEVASSQERIKPQWPLGYGELKVNFPSPLHEAISHDNLHMMDWLIENGAIVDARCNLGKTPLFETARLGELPMSKWLVDTRQADFKTRAKDGRTILHEAASNGQLDVVEWLLDVKNVDLHDKTNNGETVLYHAACHGDWDFVMWLLENKRADINAEIYRDQPILHEAALQLRFDIVKWLVMEKNADINIRRGNEKPLLHLVIRSFDWQFVEYLVLVKGADVNIKAEDETTVLHFAASINSFRQTNKVLREKSNVAVVVEEHDAFPHLISLVKWLVEDKGVNIETKSRDGKTALHIAAYCGNWNLVKWLAIEKNADVQSKDHSGRTVLHTAASRGKWDVVKLLAAPNTVEVDVEDKNGKTVLRYAVESGDLNALQWLVENKGIDVNTKLKNEETVLSCAVVHGHLPVVKWLVTDKGANLEPTQEHGNTILYEAAAARKWNVFTWLVKTVNINVTDLNNCGSTLLHRICSFVNLKTLTWLVEERHADLSVQDNCKNTLLHKAARIGSSDVIQFLVKSNKIDVTAKNNYGDMAVDVYRKFHIYNKHISTLQLLQQGTCSNAENVTSCSSEDASVRYMQIPGCRGRIPIFQGPIKYVSILDTIRANQPRKGDVRQFRNLPNYPKLPPRRANSPLKERGESSTAQ